MPDIDEDEDDARKPPVWAASMQPRQEQQRRDSENRVGRLAQDAAERAIEAKMPETFERLGINASTQESRTDFRKDMEFLRRMRTAHEENTRTAWNKFITGLVGAIFTALVGLAGWFLSQVHTK
jgi:histone H3/H4